MKVITKEQALRMHEKLIMRHGGKAGVRDEGLLELALSAPIQMFEGEPLFPCIELKASSLGYMLIRNRPFIDGNKRMGAHIILTFLALNEIELFYSQKELHDMILSVADEETSDEELARWIIKCRIRYQVY